MKWEDIDFARGRISIRRAWVAEQWTTPKSGRARSVALLPSLASIFVDLLGVRREEAMRRGWEAVPDLVFCSETGGPLHHANLERSWLRVRRLAQREGVRPLKFHCARHTYASMALASGKRIRWVADQLGHATPMLTLKTYAHAMPEEEVDLSFADFGGAERLHPAPTDVDALVNENAPDLSGRGRFGNLEHETGFEPATSTLAIRPGRRRK